MPIEVRFPNNDVWEITTKSEGQPHVSKNNSILSYYNAEVPEPFETAVYKLFTLIMKDVGLQEMVDAVEAERVSEEVKGD